MDVGLRCSWLLVPVGVFPKVEKQQTSACLISPALGRIWKPALMLETSGNILENWKHWLVYFIKIVNQYCAVKQYKYKTLWKQWFINNALTRDFIKGADAWLEKVPPILHFYIIFHLRLQVFLVSHESHNENGHDKFPDKDLLNTHAPILKSSLTDECRFTFKFIDITSWLPYLR